MRRRKADGAPGPEGGPGAAPAPGGPAGAPPAAAAPSAGTGEPAPPPGPAMDPADAVGAAGGPAPEGAPAPGTAGPDAVPAASPDSPEAAADGADGPPPAGPPANLVAALIVVALGIAAMAGARALGLGSPAEPEAGAWPFAIGAALTCLGAALAARARRTADAEAFTAASWRVAAALATMVVFVAVIGVIGFEIPTALLAFVWLRFLGGESWRLSAVTAVAITVAFYAVFVGALGVPVPHLF
ncbi:tripartite tricarboxylate transporter TctB family protein [Nocardiopsis trehalosi]|uniref:tripartite tricarboxylate transporter TctB family protein n=1 Tax=Nocardiopsis trehalosi TaxID=109329 RepID=UPI001FE0FF60|nr:tripartite tricarboxylate transporter TctB family protein [Nocardiopsis trehalosi]